MTAKQINVLVVDDEKAIREMIIIALSMAGMKARGAKSGKTAIDPQEQEQLSWHQTGKFHPGQA